MKIELWIAFAVDHLGNVQEGNDIAGHKSYKSKKAIYASARYANSYAPFYENENTVIYKCKDYYTKKKHYDIFIKKNILIKESDIVKNAK